MSEQYNQKLIPLAKHMRTDATKQENRLWYEFLNKYKPRFQRQKTIDNFIVDFYCHSAKLAIELDGSGHGTEQSIVYDERRTEILKDYGIKVIRFSNSEIEQNFYYVCEYIDKTVKDELSRLQNIG